MATLTVVEAARVTGVSRSQLYRYIRSGKLSRTPEGLLDTTELLRAGLMLHVPSVSPPVPQAHDATNSAVAFATEPVSRVPSADTATLERLIDVLQSELDAAREREKLLTQRMHERETHLTQEAHERETLLLQLLAQVHQQNQRLLDIPRPDPSRRAPESRPAIARPDTPSVRRGAMRRRILALLQDYPEGLTPAEMKTLLRHDRRLASTVLGMRRDGLLQRVARGRYVLA